MHPVDRPFRAGGALRLLGGNLAPHGGAVVKVAGVEGGVVDGRFTGRARTFDGERALVGALERDPSRFGDGDMVVIRYVGSRGAPGMPELLDPTSRITSLCRSRGITVGLLTDGRFSGGSVGLVVGHVAPEAYLGGPIALVQDGDTIVVDLVADRVDCLELEEDGERARRADAWRRATESAGGLPPGASPVTTRLLARMRATAQPALRGGGMLP